MSKMNLKSTLWTLAFAVAAVSCSDELEEGGGTGTGNEENGEGVYLSVNIATTTTGAATKASKDAEDGDFFLQGSDEERKVHDINIYLVEAKATADGVTGTGATAISDGTTGLAVVNADASMRIVGHGYSYAVNENNHNDQINHTANTVRIEVDEVPTTETVYHVLAVTNLGKSVSFSTLGELRDAVKTPSTTGTDWNGGAWLTGTGLPTGTEKFIMSSHQMWDATLNEGSSVTISTENMDKNNPATATVYVERLAARIDLKLTEALMGKGDGNTNGAEVDNPVKVEGSTNSGNAAKDYIKLTGYQVINRWNGDNYMLKRVSKELTGTATEYPSLATATDLTFSYLGDEIYNSASYKYNYVIDPATLSTATTQKNEKNVGTLATSYTSHYDAGLNSKDLNDASNNPFTRVSDIKSSTFTEIMYTKENCLDLDNQITGLATGIIFQGNYTPNAVSVFKADMGSGKAGVDAVAYTAGSDFYIVNDFSTTDDASRFLCADLTTIGALSFSNLVEDKNKTYTSDLMKALFDAGTNNWGSVSFDNLKEAVNAMIGGTINVAYKEYLHGLIAPTTGTAPSDIDEISVTKAKWSTFLTSENITDPAGAGDDWTTASKTLYDTYNVAYYKGGVSYYPYYIRHEDNGNDALAGPMEFCIVRNNVYQVDVKGVNALGYPLPFITPVDTPVEVENVFLQVQIYVKDWVVRSNSEITL